MSDHAHEEHHDHVPTYVKLAAVLFVVTALEVVILYMAIPDSLMLTGLYGLAALKFGFVVAVFMHLKYDSKFLTGIFFSGFVVAFATMIAMIALINYQPSLKETTVYYKSSEDWKKANTGNPDNGKMVFVNKGCTACHKVSSVEGAVGVTGPALDGLGKTAAARKDGMDAKSYIRESIMTPNAFIVPSYPSGLMPANLKATMTDEEFKDLVEFLTTL